MHLRLNLELLDGLFDCSAHDIKQQGPEVVRSRVMKMRIDLWVGGLVGKVWRVRWMGGWVAGSVCCWVDGLVDG